MRVVAIIQARMGSSRLPGKTLADICGKPLLLRIMERVRAARKVHEVVLATTIQPEDRPLLELTRRHGLRGYAGSVDDVLDRFYQAARLAGADAVVRITADDPFKDPQVIDLIVARLLDDSRLDYVSNTIEPTFPEGLDVEAFRFSALEKAWREAMLASEREHVTPYIWKNPDRFRTASVFHSSDLSGLRWTLDYEKDLIFTRAVYDRLSCQGLFLMNDILELLRTAPDLSRINEGIERNKGYALSLSRDSETASQERPRPGAESR